MDHEQFATKIKKAVGGKIPMAMRDRWGKFLRDKDTKITLRYEWITVPSFYTWLLDCDEVDFGEGVEIIEIWICGFGRVGH